LTARRHPAPAGAPERMLFDIALVFAIIALTAGLARLVVLRGARERVASARLAAMGTATARILHQVKNPLQTLILHAEMLQDEALISDPGVRREVCQTIIGEAMRMAELLAGLSAYASGAQRRIHPSPVPLDGLVADAARAAAQDAKGIEMAVGPLEPVSVDADPYLLRQALDHVLRNAREAFDPPPAAGGPPRIEVALRRRGGEAVVVVRDNGHGIERSRLRAVLEPFVTTKPKRMGLGLAICRDIVEAHGGRLALRSRPGAGTTVTLSLPARPEAPRVPAA